MEEFEVSYSLENEQQFWDELEDIISTTCGSDHQLIDNALRSYIHFTTTFFDAYLSTPYSLAECCSRLLKSELFTSNLEYVRLQLVYSLLQEDEPHSLHVIASLLLFGGREDEGTFEVMMGEGCFLRLIECINDGRRRQANADREEEEEGGESHFDSALHRLMLELLYEMSRAQRLSAADLQEIDDGFVMYLFQIIEELSDDVDDPYHYPVIRVLLVLNEQYMVASTASTGSSTTQITPPTNRVIKILSIHGSQYMTFSENLILLLNRETETSLQLLILKLLYLLFTTPSTAEYFYTNDLRVLLDVIIRNLLDLPNELGSLRHTYLRVLYPLLAYTQLSHAGTQHYKREEIIKTLAILGGGGGHFDEADETTIRLVERVAQVPWLKDTSMDDADVAKKLLGISLTETEAASSVSVGDVAGVSAEPGVQTPSRNADDTGGDGGAGGAALRKTAEEIEEEKAREEVVEGLKLSAGMEKQRRAPPAPPVPRVTVNKQAVLNANSDSGVPQKKVPPTAPPRRRTRLKTSISAEVQIAPAE